MATRTDVLRLKITQDGSGKVKYSLAEVGNSLDNVDKKAKKTSKSTFKLGFSFRRMITPIAGMVSVLGGLNKLVAVTREFDVLNAQLVTATGNAENARLAFDEILKFATETPYNLQQVTDSFVNLVNFGLDPSQRALAAYGNTSAALGKDLNQMIEAVADAITGEFERLKEFGIKASSEGEKIKFTFRGVTTEVGKNAREIENYLIGLGENEFAGAMQQRMQTLDGAISNLGDEWDKLFLRLSSQGIGDAITVGVRTAISSIEELNARLASGELTASIAAVGNKFDGVGSDFAYTLDIMDQLFSDFAENTSIEGEDLAGFLVNAFSSMPENIRAFVKIMTVELAAFVDKSAAYGTEILENLQFWKDESFDLEGRLNAIDSARQDSIDVILKERDASLDSFDKQIAAANNLRAKYDEMQKNRPSTDLGQFRVGGGRQAGAGANGSTDEDLAARIEKVREATLTETQLEAEKYIRQQALLDEATQRGLDVHAIREAAERAHQERMLDIVDEKISKEKALEEQTNKARLSSASNLFGGLAQLAQQGGQKYFKVWKQLARAQAIVDTYSGATAAYKALAGIPVVGPGLGAAAAAAAVAAGLARVSAINQTSLSSQSAGSVPSGGGGAGGGAVPPVVPTTNSNLNDTGQQGGVVQVILNGVLTEDLVRDRIAPALAREVEFSEVSILPTNSRDAQNIIDAAVAASRTA